MLACYFCWASRHCLCPPAGSRMCLISLLYLSWCCILKTTWNVFDASSNVLSTRTNLLDWNENKLPFHWPRVRLAVSTVCKSLARSMFLNVIAALVSFCPNCVWKESYLVFHLLNDLHMRLIDASIIVQTLQRESQTIWMNKQRQHGSSIRYSATKHTHR